MGSYQGLGLKKRELMLSHRLEEIIEEEKRLLPKDTVHIAIQIFAYTTILILFEEVVTTTR